MIPLLLCLFQFLFCRRINIPLLRRQNCSFFQAWSMIWVLPVYNSILVLYSRLEKSLSVSFLPGRAERPGWHSWALFNLSSQSLIFSRSAIKVNMWQDGFAKSWRHVKGFKVWHSFTNNVVFTKSFFVIINDRNTASAKSKVQHFPFSLILILLNFSGHLGWLICFLNAWAGYGSQFADPCSRASPCILIGLSLPREIVSAAK